MGTPVPLVEHCRMTAAPDGGRLRGDSAPSRYSHLSLSIFWSPLPGITQILPAIGHAGIVSSSGQLFDFAGPYQINLNTPAFGQPTRVHRLDINKVPGQTIEQKKKNFDKAVLEANAHFGKTMHNIFCNNCHHHVAMALNKMQYDGQSNWTQVSVAKMAILKGESLSLCGRVSQWAVFVVLMILLIIKYF